MTLVAKHFSRLKVVGFSTKSNKERPNFSTSVFYCLFSDMKFAVVIMNAACTE